MDQKFDTIVIGFGKAGKTLAAKLAKQGEKVALIEKDARMYGGTCINVGCIPSKRLVLEAERAPAHDFEVQSEYYHVAVQEKKKLTTALRMANYNKLIDAGVQVINGTASFLDGKTIGVKGAHGTMQTLSASKLIINTGVELTKRGAVVTDKHLRTTAENIWAAGDVCGNLQFTYISLDDSRIILSDMQGDGSRTTENRGAFAYSVFMEPSFSRAGLSEKEAADKGLNYRVVRMNTDMIPKAKVLRKTTGMLKAVIDKDSGEIFGAALFCPESYEIINMVKLAMDHDLDYTVLRDFIYTHPTMSEGLNDLFAL